MGKPSVVGVDVGGTATRAMLTTLDGRVLGLGRAGSGNPVARDPKEAAAEVGTALRQALAVADGRDVIAGLVGLAGHLLLLENPAVSAAYQAEWSAAGLRCPMWTEADTVVTFAAGTAVPDGSVLIAGTGAIAAEIRSWQVVRCVDGLGWLLGDEGSGFWVGLAGARAAVRQLRAGGPPSLLTQLVTAGLGVATDAEALIVKVYLVPRSDIAALAPSVCAAATDGDSTAQAIVRDAAERLIRTLGELGPPAGPVVLAGGLLTNDTPVRQALIQQLGPSAIIAHDGAAGAAWLAARTSGRLDETVATALHSRLVGASAGV